MIVEEIDPGSGAILFKKDKHTKDLESRVKDLEKSNKELLRRVKILEDIIKKDSV